MSDTPRATDTDQEWFRHPEMQRRISQAEGDFREGRIVRVATPEEAQKYLDSLKNPPTSSTDEEP